MWLVHSNKTVFLLGAVHKGKNRPCQGNCTYLAMKEKEREKKGKSEKKEERERKQLIHKS
jgi:hypothetical protein